MARLLCTIKEEPGESYIDYAWHFHKEVHLTKNLVDKTAIKALYQGIQKGELTTLFTLKRSKTYLAAY